MRANKIGKVIYATFRKHKGVSKFVTLFDNFLE